MSKKIHLAATIVNGKYFPEHGYINLVLLNLIFNFLGWLIKLKIL